MTETILIVVTVNSCCHPWMWHQLTLLDRKKDHQTNLFVVIQKAAESSSTESCWWNFQFPSTKNETRFSQAKQGKAQPERFLLPFILFHELMWNRTNLPLTGLSSDTSQPRYSATVIMWFTMQSISWEYTQVSSQDLIHPENNNRNDAFRSSCTMLS